MVKQFAPAKTEIAHQFHFQNYTVNFLARLDKCKN